MMSWVLGETPEKKTKKEKPEGLPKGVEKILPLLTKSQVKLVKQLCSPEIGQQHLFEHWAASSEDVQSSPSLKRKFIQQLEALDKAYADGGLAGYIRKSRKLLEKSKNGVNPLAGWTPTVPSGKTFDLGTDGYAEMEAIGLRQIGNTGFVLVAGGLGERLGYSGIKVSLPIELATGTSYLQYYIEYILAVQAKYAPVIDDQGTRQKLPLCIMTSADTNAKTRKYLEEHNNFGMTSDQITIVQQGQGVPALMDNEATLALDPNDKYKLMTKPHGHGDIHSLLYEHEVASTWADKGIKWITFFQDTNGLAFHTLPLVLGVSYKHDLVMNSLAVPRKAKQAIGAITKLVDSRTEETRTINVEYNHLDPLLRANGYPDGDVNDEETGYSPFPGNINQLVFKLEPYVLTLEMSRGIMPEFVNPKYADAEKTKFKKPTRLECMMQDFPTVLDEDYSKKVGFTSVPADMCFSPVKNSNADGAALQKKGTEPGVAATGEADQYASFRKILRHIGVQVEDGEPETYQGITVTPGPRIIIKPSAALCLADYKKIFPTPEKVNLSPKSSLVISGSGDLVIESMDLDGAAVVICQKGRKGIIRDLWIKNEGWVTVPEESSTDEVIAMRGYSLSKKDTSDIVFQNTSDNCVIL